jgi:hypothetical protein
MSIGPSGKKSPLKVAPLRDPGESLGAELYDLVYGKMLLWGMVGLVGILFAGYEWLRWGFSIPPQPWVASGVALVMVGLAAWQIARTYPRAKQVGLGYQGEKAVGQCLEQLRASGYQVIHDVPGEGCNVDHVLVGPGGVFAIETKTRMKPRGRPSEVVFDGETVTVDGHKPDRDPIVQVRAAARQVKEIVRRTTGLEVQVRPVVLFPGWYIEPGPKSDVWVLHENAFLKWVGNEPAVLDIVKVRQIAEGIAIHVRNHRQS